MESILEKLNHDESKGKEHDDKKEEGDSSDEEEQPNIPLAGGAVLIGSTKIPENLTSDVDEEEEEHGIKGENQVIHEIV
jgi:hypothetical protein